ncbi:methylated-DNA--[protein]-cysteine S-methyltransferase [Streptomyces sp. NBRC 109706]|uniref:methylated-DNA--[protein]-cysteine S-methyltransferase n=1 Tax=Streptomyces sp. NBRC 109706 TaxID=1550035 RepID=UPI000782E59D|nr:methylated-DNA--[protein]-cysteine S-methyltransferase [Streptomyces sp. NBRC 109706]
MTEESGCVWAVEQSPIGPLLLVASAAGLVQVAFHADPGTVRRALARLSAELGVRAEPAPAGHPVVAEAAEQLAAYFAGRRRAFELPLDWSLTSGFTQRVLRELAVSVPLGSVVTYQELALRVGEPGAAQAVGGAMGANPLPVVVPCHRVVASGGGIGGFSGGLETKRELLALEGVLPSPLF